MTAVVVPAPYWGQPGHLGWIRVERFVRWLGQKGVQSIVVRAGLTDSAEGTTFGELITVRDPIGFFGDPPAGRRAALPPRPTNRLRRVIAYLLMVPDPVVAWARRAAAHPLALEAAHGASVVLASSPPESVHVAAAGLARRLGARLVMDLRDGWLDEPMIPLLRASAAQRLRHRRLEARLLGQADRVLVTSEAWRRLLAARLPAVADRIAVVTNCYPQARNVPAGMREGEGGGGPLTLLYAGKFFSSRSERRIEELFGPLLDGIKAAAGGAGRVRVVGNLVAEERTALASWSRRLEEHGWRVEVRPPVDHETVLELMGSADGLLLLSSSMASLPAKLFDYLASGRPILAVAPQDSAVWEVSRSLRQVWTADPGAPDAARVAAGFLAACSQPGVEADLPERFSEAFVRRRFLSALAPCLPAATGR